MPQNGKPHHELLNRRAIDVVAQVPPGSFTFDEFLSHATGLNAIDNARDIGPMLKYLTDNEVIRRVDVPVGQSARWVRCAPA